MTPQEKLELEMYRATEYDASGAVCNIDWKKISEALFKHFLKQDKHK